MIYLKDISLEEFISMGDFIKMRKSTKVGITKICKNSLEIKFFRVEKLPMEILELHALHRLWVGESPLKLIRRYLDK